MLNLGEQLISGAFPEPGGRQPVQRAIPLELVRCDMTRDQDACGLVQIRHTVPGSILYQSYWYRSGVNRTMTATCTSIAAAVEDLVGLSRRRPRRRHRLQRRHAPRRLPRAATSASSASTPPTSPATRSRRATTSCATSSARARCASATPTGEAKVITSIAMFYDLEDPAAFVRDVADSLAEDGVWVMELHYLPLMLQHNAFDVIVHEHLEYYSLAVLERLFAEAGLEVVDGELNDINGGSIRLFIAHAGRREPTAGGRASALQELRMREFEMALDSPAPYEEFARNVERVGARAARRCASRSSRDGKTIHIYGASTKGNTILQYADLDSAPDPLRRRPQPRQVGLGDDRDRHPVDQRGGVARDAAPTTTSCCPGTSSTSSCSASASTSTAAAASSSRCPRCG